MTPPPPEENKADRRVNCLTLEYSALTLARLVLFPTKSIFVNIILMLCLINQDIVRYRYPMKPPLYGRDTADTA